MIRRPVSIPTLVGLCLIAPFVYAQAAKSSQPPVAPGTLFDIGGHRLHLYCTGSGSPTVILESGLGAYSIDWALVQPTVAKSTRVCSYDRAGYAWSDQGPEPRGLHTSVSELHRLLSVAGIKPPYVVVGQSWGGRIVRVFAHTYPKEVVGMVLIDTYSESESALQQAVLASLDTQEVEEDDPADNLPSELRLARTWAQAQPRQQDISDPDEPEAAIESTTAKDRVPLGDKPLIVISAGRLSWDANDRASGKVLRKELAAHVQEEAFLATLSRNSRFLIGHRSFHQVHMYEPDLVADAIRQVLISARTGKRLEKVP